MTVWTFIHPNVTKAQLGLLFTFFSEDDPTSARGQINKNYAHGGGWQPLKGFTLSEEGLHYPGDPVFKPLAETKLNGETIRLYTSVFVAIIQPDGSYEVGRVD